MPDLKALFRDLTKARQQVDWQTALLASPLGDAKVMGHPLGFKVVRLDAGPFSLRLHLWRGHDTSQPGFEVHDHGFDLESFVLSGAVRQLTYAADVDASGDHVIYEVAYEADQSILRRTNRLVRLRELENVIVTPGQSYRVAAGELHSSRMDDCDEAMTLVLACDRGRLPITIGPRDGPADLRAARRPLSDRSLRNLGLRVAQAL